MTVPAWPEPPDAVEGYLIRSSCNHFDADQNQEVRLLQIAFDLLIAREVAVTAHTPILLTPEEFTSLIEVAVASPDPNIPASHLAKLVTLGYVTVTAKGLVVTGDGLIRITESE